MAHQGIHVLEQEEGGVARRCTLDSLASHERALEASQTFDRRRPKSEAGAHENFDAVVSKFLKVRVRAHRSIASARL